MTRTLLGVLSLLVLTLPLSAQEREIERSNVPRDLADRLIGIANDPATIRFDGESHVPSDSLLPSDLLVMGSLRLAGRVQGAVVVVNGDLDLEPGAEISGDLVVVGGEIRGDGDARVGGTLMAFQPMASRVSPILAERASAPASDMVGVQRRFHSEGRSGFDLNLGSYNRVEGLPVAFGPGFTTRGRNPLRADAALIWRTEGRAPFQEDRLGYRVEVEQFLGGRRELRVGGGLFSLITPIESWGITDSENALSTFVFTSDQRDHFEMRGAHAYVRVTPRAAPLDLRIGYRDERSGSVAPQDPWTFFSRGHPWRDQPLVAEGRIRSVIGQLGIDTRDRIEEPRGGWFVKATWQEGVGGGFSVPGGALPAADPEAAPTVLPEVTVSDRFSSAFLDIRRYNSLGRGNYLNLRGVVGGAPSGDRLPAQYQMTLGGVGTLPGFPLFAADCGARDGRVAVERDGVVGTMVPFYGCDRVALFQAEYRGSLGGFLGWGGNARRRSQMGNPRWVVFFDAGKGWAEESWGGFARAESPTLYDAGLGVLLGDLGVYWAKPFGELAGGSTLTVRLGRRF